MFQKAKTQGKVQVRVIEGRDLPRKDGVTLFGGGTSDPYCIVKLNNSGSSQKTKIVKKNINPYWNETFTLDIFNPTQDVLHFEIRDWDLGLNRDDYMGHVTFPISNLRDQGKETDLWLSLSGAKTGQLHVAITPLDFGNKPAPQQQPGYPPQQPGYPPQYPPQQPGYPPQHPPQQPGYPPQQPGYPPQYPPQQPGYPPQYPPQQPGYPPQQPGYPPQYPPQQPGYPPQQPGYPPQQPGYGMPPPMYAPPQGKMCHKCNGSGQKPPKQSKKGKFKPARPCKKCSGTGRA